MSKEIINIFQNKKSNI